MKPNSLKPTAASAVTEPRRSRLQRGALPLRVIVAPDKFKGTLTAAAAAAAIARGWRRSRPGDRVELLPLSDGGDGFGRIMAGLLHARPAAARTVDAAHRPLSARWWWEPHSRTALIESATVIGLALLPAGQFHPFDLDTFGLGAILRAAAARGARRCVIGIGGSATNDGGFGLARALGWRFLDSTGAELTRWTDLARLVRIVRPTRRTWPAHLVVATDVGNPLLGPRGASRVYGPQKGLRPADVAPAEACLRHLAFVAAQGRGPDRSLQPGAGAAGGLGFGLTRFLGAHRRSGFQLFARQARLDHRLAHADLVLSGEGALDPSTLMGKGVGELARRCRARGLPCVGLAGVVAHPRRLRGLFAAVHAIAPAFATPEAARARAAGLLETLAETVASSWRRQADPSRGPARRALTAVGRSGWSN